MRHGFQRRIHQHGAVVKDLDLHAGSDDALRQVLDGRGGRRDDVYLDAKTDGTHPERVLHALLLVDGEIPRQRVQDWVLQYPKLFSEFHDSDGRPPRHTFFFPIDQYEAEHVDALSRPRNGSLSEAVPHLMSCCDKEY